MQTGKLRITTSARRMHNRVRRAVTYRNGFPKHTFAIRRVSVNLNSFYTEFAPRSRNHSHAISRNGDFDRVASRYLFRNIVKIECDGTGERTKLGENREFLSNVAFSVHRKFRHIRLDIAIAAVTAISTFSHARSNSRGKRIVTIEYVGRRCR